jgi:hypothetical protein
MPRKVISRFEWFVLIVISLLLLSFALQKCGVNVLNVKEDSEIIDRPHD